MKRFPTFLICVGGIFSVNLMAQPGMDGQGGGGGNSSSDLTAPYGATYTLSDGSTVTKSGETITNSGNDYNVVQVSNGTLYLTSCTLTKTGDTTTSGGDATSFYGTNSSIFATGSTANIIINNSTVNSTADGANAVFAYNGGTITVNGITIVNQSSRSRGLHATYGGSITASDVDITTNSETSSTIATDRGGGYVYVTGGTATAKGNKSAVLYSTGTVEVTNLTGVSEAGEIGDVEGDNHITMTNCTMTSGSSERGLMMLQSGSGDAEGSNAYINAISSTLTTTDADAPLCEVPTLNNGTLNLTDCTLSIASGVLMYVDYNTQWSTYGGTGNLNLYTTQDTWTYTGAVKADAYSNVNVLVGENVIWQGSNDADNTAVTADVTVNNGGTWILTSNSYVNTLVNNGTIYLNGYTLTYDNLTGNTPLNETSVEGVRADAAYRGSAYTVSGQRVNNDSKGIIVQKGKKYVNN
ncbi:MAG: hypothetical protein K6E54_02925 [Bacteroidaceae bacterium]|nr:hypothetical protein [Bacteroidaceae bacterium]